MLLTLTFERIVSMSTGPNQCVLQLSDEDLRRLTAAVYDKNGPDTNEIRFTGPQCVVYDGVRISLDRTGSAILRAVLENQERTLPIAELVRILWSGYLDEDSLKTYLRRLRKRFRIHGKTLPMRTFTRDGVRFVKLDM